jgi:ribose transport system substrate-binding protein
MKLKKIIALILTGAMVFSMAACKSQESDTKADPTGGAGVTQGAGDTPSSSGSTDGYVIGFSNGYWGNTWRAQMVEDFETRCKEYEADGILSDYMISNTEGDATEQLNQINAMIDAGVDAILIDAVSPTTIQSAVVKAQNAGILVVIANDPAAYEGTYCVCGNNYSWQKIQDVWLAEQLGGSGNIVRITGVSGNAADTLRQQADTDVFAKYTGIKILGSAPGNWSQTDAQSVMTTFLSSYDNIDAVLTQDVMAEGILKAFENAGKEPTLMTGDYTKSFLTKWSQMDSLNTIAVPYAPGNAVTVLDVAVRLLQGKTIDSSILVANPMDSSMVNTIVVDPPYVVTRDGDANAVWMEGLNGTKAITLDQAIELMKDKADTAALDGYLSQEEVDKFFTD